MTMRRRRVALPLAWLASPFAKGLSSVLGALAAPAQATDPATAGDRTARRLRLASPVTSAAGSLALADPARPSKVASGAADLVPCASGPMCLQRLAEGKADLALVGDTAIVLAAHAGQPLEVLATVSTARLPGLLARGDRGYLRPDKLPGARVGYIHGTSGHYFTDLFLTFHRLTDQVRRIPLDPSRAAQALAAGEVDAAGLLDPWRQQAQALLGERLVVLTASLGYTATVNLVARPGQPPQDLLPVMRGLQQAVAALNTAGATEPADTRSGYRHGLRLDQSLLNLLEAQSRWAQREGLVPDGAPPDFLQLMRPQVLAQIDPTRVTLVAPGVR